MNQVLLIGEPTPLFISLRDKLVQRSDTVHELSHSSQEEAASAGEPGQNSETNLSALNRWDSRAAPVNRIVLGQARIATALPQTAEEAEAFALSHENALVDFLLLLQAAGKMLARQGGGQIWVINQEQSLRYFSPLETSPVDTFARRAAVKSFAREIRRMNVRVNCLSVQTCEEEKDASEWRALSPDTRIYASRFKPCRADAIADVICGFLDHEDLPMSGLDVPVGIGLTEQNT